MILSDWIKQNIEYLERAGIENAKYEPYLWLSQISGKNRAFFISHANDETNGLFSETQRFALEEISRRRQKNEPLAYIIGSLSFWGHIFRVGPGVLIPRSDSETVIETALSRFGLLPFPSGQTNGDRMPETAAIPAADGTFRFMDLCTGSGCLGISIGLALNQKGINCKGVLTEISPDALTYADINICAHDLQKNLLLCACDLLPERNVLSDFWGPEQADLILSNPPYITDEDMTGLMPDVSDYEPQIALRGGADGLVFYRRILSEATPLLASGGILVMEHGYDQGESVPALCREYGYEHVQCIRDYGGNPRVTAAKKI